MMTTLSDVGLKMFNILMKKRMELNSCNKLIKIENQEGLWFQLKCNEVEMLMSDQYSAIEELQDKRVIKKIVFCRNRHFMINEQYLNHFHRDQFEKNKFTSSTSIEDDKKSYEEEYIYYGKFVKLTESEYKDLMLWCRKNVLDFIIDEMEDYLESSGRQPYKEYPPAIRNWIRKKMRQGNFDNY